MPSTTAFNKMRVKITLLRSITKNLPVMQLTVTAEGYDGSHHARCAVLYHIA